MGQILREIIDSWADGVINSMEPDAVPKSAYIRGRNAALTSIGGGKAVVMKRLGMTCLNATAITGSSAIVGIHEFRRRGASSFTHYHLVVSDNGRLDRFDSDDGDLTVIDATAFTSSSSQEYTPDFEDANNLCFIVNGAQQKKFNGTSLQTFGIVAPSSAPTIADAGDSGNHNGTYEARVTFYNGDTGQESSAGTTSSAVAITNSSINWTSIPTSADSQVTARRLYLRNTATQANFYLAGTVSGNVTTTASTNLLDSSLTDVGPDTDENDPPPSTGRYVVFHKGRMWVLTTTDAYYSKLAELPNGDTGLESFHTDDRFETPSPQNGQIITGAISAFDLLIIFKSNSVVALEGDDPETWEFKDVSTHLGCVSHRSIVRVGDRIFWWSEEGPVVWRAGGVPELLAKPFIAATVDPDVLDFDDAVIKHITATRDILEDRILFAVPELGQTRNTLILPFNHRVERWESDGWDPMDVCTLATVDDEQLDGQPYVVIGNYGGQFFRYGNTANDGIRTGTTSSGTFTASGTSVTTITDLTATFDTTGAGLKERKVTVVDSNGDEPDPGIRRRITSNTATAITLNTSISSLVDGETYTYYIGGPAFDWESAWLHQDDAFQKKRYMFVYAHFRVAQAIDNLKVNFYQSYNINPDVTTLTSVTATVPVDLWDEADWDDMVWSGSGGDVQTRFRVGRTGTALLVRFRNYEPDTEFSILKLGVMSEFLSERIG